MAVQTQKTSIMSAQSFYGSLDITTLVEMYHAKHSSMTIGKNGKVYANINVWANEEPDKFGDHLSIQLNSTKEGLERDKTINPKGKDGSQKNKCYVGRGKRSNNDPQPLNNSNAPALSLGGPGQPQQPGADNSGQWQAQGNGTGLPF